MHYDENAAKLSVTTPLIIRPTVQFNQNKVFWDKIRHMDTVIGHHTFIDDHCVIWGGSYVGHHCHIGAYTRLLGTVSNSVRIGSGGTLNARIGPRTNIGDNATMLCVKIGSLCNIGNGVGIGLWDIDTRPMDSYMRQFFDQKMVHVSIGHEVEIQDDVMIYPNAHIEDSVRIGANTIIDMRAKLPKNMVIPENAHVGSDIKMTDELLDHYKPGHSPAWYMVYRENYSKMKKINPKIKHLAMGLITSSNYVNLYFSDRSEGHQFVNGIAGSAEV